MLILEKLTSKKLYQILISSRTDKVTSVTYFETKSNATKADWTKHYITTSDDIRYIFAFFPL